MGLSFIFYTAIVFVGTIYLTKNYGLADNKYYLNIEEFGHILKDYVVRGVKK